MANGNKWGGARSNSGPKKQVLTQLELEQKQNALAELELGSDDVVTLLIKAKDRLEAAQDQALAGILHQTGMSRKDFVTLMQNAPELLPFEFHSMLAQFNKTREVITKAEYLLPNATPTLLLTLKEAIEAL